MKINFLFVYYKKSYELIEKKPTTAVFTRNELNSFDTSRFQEENETNNQQNQLQLDYSNHELILERQKKFKQLEGDIVDLNSMFKDLAVMVHDQGEIIGIFNRDFTRLILNM